MKEIWTKIKCFFGFCKDLEKLKKEQIEAINKAYKVEPKVQTLNIKEEFGNNVGETLDVKVTDTANITKTGVTKAKTEKDSEKHQHLATLKNTKKTQKVIKSVKETKKVKRHWYNNSKTQKLVPEGEETKLPKTWKKGKLKTPKKDK